MNRNEAINTFDKLRRHAENTLSRIKPHVNDMEWQAIVDLEAALDHFDNCIVTRYVDEWLCEWNRAGKKHDETCKYNAVGTWCFMGKVFDEELMENLPFISGLDTEDIKDQFWYIYRQLAGPNTAAKDFEECTNKRRHEHGNDES